MHSRFKSFRLVFFCIPPSNSGLISRFGWEVKLYFLFLTSPIVFCATSLLLWVLSWRWGEQEKGRGVGGQQRGFVPKFWTSPDSQLDWICQRGGIRKSICSRGMNSFVFISNLRFLVSKNPKSQVPRSQNLYEPHRGKYIEGRMFRVGGHCSIFWHPVKRLKEVWSHHPKLIQRTPLLANRFKSWPQRPCFSPRSFGGLIPF